MSIKLLEFKPGAKPGIETKFSILTKATLKLPVRGCWEKSPCSQNYRRSCSSSTTDAKTRKQMLKEEPGISSENTYREDVAITRLVYPRLRLNVS